jgi:hypothetical protein
MGSKIGWEFPARIGDCLTAKLRAVSRKVEPESASKHEVMGGQSAEKDEASTFLRRNQQVQQDGPSG